MPHCPIVTGARGKFWLREKVFLKEAGEMDELKLDNSSNVAEQKVVKSVIIS